MKTSWSRRSDISGKMITTEISKPVTPCGRRQLAEFSGETTGISDPRPLAPPRGLSDGIIFVSMGSFKPA